MTSRPPRGHRSGSERLVSFTDAVAAIGLTLLVLPLVDLVPGAGEPRPEIGELLRDNLPRFGAFLLSFLVIFRFWWAHHRLFEHISSVSRPVIALSAVWCFAIVFLPVPTAIITGYRSSASTVLVYDGVLLLLSGSLLLLAVTARRHPELTAGREPVPGRLVAGLGSTVGALVVALVLGVVLPHAVGFWALLLLVVAGVVEGAVERRRRGREAAA